MASVTTESGGRRTVQVMLPDGRRTSIRLGKCSQSKAELVAEHVEALRLARGLGLATLPKATANWLAGVTDEFYDRLARAQLVDPKDDTRLGPFLDSYVQARGDVKPATSVVWGHTIRCLKAYFGADRALRAITEGDAAEWRAWLATNEKLSDATIRRRTGIARQFFRHGRRKRLLAENPFEGLSAAVPGNADKFHFVTLAEAEAVLEHCPTLEWRLLFALARWGGLRVPSEPLALTWGDIDWGRGRFLVHAPKTEHHPGRGTRWVPLFPQIERPMRDAFAQAPEGSLHVFTNPVWRHRLGTLNLRKGLSEILRKAGLKQWPKLWVNLRATRATELRQQGFAEHVCTAWLGHSDRVAAAHYLQVRDADFERALAPEAVQNPVQRTSAGPRNDNDSDSGTPENTAPGCNRMQDKDVSLGVTGLEPASESTYETGYDGRRRSKKRSKPAQRLSGRLSRRPFLRRARCH